MNVASWSWPPFVFLLGPIEGLDINDCLGEGFRRLLRQIVANVSRDIPVRILAREFLGVSAGIRMRRDQRLRGGSRLFRNGCPRPERRRRLPPRRPPYVSPVSLATILNERSPDARWK